MKKVLFSISCMLYLIQIGLCQTAVTFTVDITGAGLTPSANGVHIAGNFADPNYDGSVINSSYTNWSPSAMAMTDNGNGTFSITLNLLPEHYEFKFVNGNDWTYVEDVPNICQVELNGNDNRVIEVGANAINYSACYASCSLCGTSAVLVRVDMSTIDADGDGITGEAGEDFDPANLHVAGNFADPNYDNLIENATYANWDPGFISLNDMGNGVYGVLLQLSPATYDYKFVNGNSWGFEEGANGTCFVGGNRQVVVDQPNVITEAFCFGTCASCIMPTMVTFRVNMSDQSVSPNGVHIAGSFQGWDPGAADWAMSPVGNNIYELVKEVPFGTYEFKFINGNAWSGINNTIESVPDECTSNYNRVLVVDGAAVNVEFCFGKCSFNCNSGCTNAEACNYTPGAIQDNGSCLFIGQTCNDSLISTITDVINDQCICSGNLIDLNGNNESSFNGLFYQAVIRSSDGTLMPNQNITVRFTLHKSTPTGAIEYQETQAVMTNNLGLVTTLFGTGQEVTGTFNTINWGVDAKYLEVEINLNGWQSIGIQQLSAVPYAIRAKEVDADGLKLQSPNGNCFILQVDNSGNISTLSVPCQD
jgi:hypothetical protein